MRNSRRNLAVLTLLFALSSGRALAGDYPIGPLADCPDPTQVCTTAAPPAAEPDSVTTTLTDIVMLVIQGLTFRP